MAVARRIEAVRLPPIVSGEPAAVAAWAREEFDALTRRLNTLPLLQLDVLHVEPSKPRQGMLAFADGTDWDPGSGEGVYVYLAAGWSKL